jgi:hypothetical protein
MRFKLIQRSKRAGIAVASALILIPLAQAGEQGSPLTEPPKGKLTAAAARAEADRRIAEYANKHVHEQCAVQERALAALRVESESASSQPSADWQLVLARSELDLERCYRESMAGLAAFIGRKYLLERWGFKVER